jgi:hypothetical protein
VLCKCERTRRPRARITEIVLGVFAKIGHHLRVGMHLSTCRTGNKTNGAGYTGTGHAPRKRGNSLRAPSIFGFIARERRERHAGLKPCPSGWPLRPWQPEGCMKSVRCSEDRHRLWPRPRRLVLLDRQRRRLRRRRKSARYQFPPRPRRTPGRSRSAAFRQRRRSGIARTGGGGGKTGSCGRRQTRPLIRAQVGARLRDVRSFSVRLVG